MGWAFLGAAAVGTAWWAYDAWAHGGSPEAQGGPSGNPPVQAIANEMQEAASSQSSAPPQVPERGSEDELQRFAPTGLGATPPGDTGEYQIWVEGEQRAVSYGSYLQWIAALRTHYEPRRTVAVRFRIDANTLGPWIRVNMARNGYINALSSADNPWNSWREMTTAEERYPNDDAYNVEIGLGSIQGAMRQARDWAGNPGNNNLTRNTINIILFAVAFATNQALTGVDMYNWRSFGHLLRNWSRYSNGIFNESASRPRVGISLGFTARYARQGSDNFRARRPEVAGFFDELSRYCERLARLTYPAGFVPRARP